MVNEKFLFENLSYDETTGLFIWLKDQKRGQIKAGTQAGSLALNGYIEIGFQGQRIYAHELAWFFKYGEWVKNLDHKNRNRTDNSINNLRKATYSENCCNSSLRTDNTSVIKGVSFDKRRNTWNAEVRKDGLRVRKSGFSSKEEAADWVISCRQKLHGEFFSV